MSDDHLRTELIEEETFIDGSHVRDDGTLAASGLCDPKMLYDEKWCCFKTT